MKLINRRKKRKQYLLEVKVQRQGRFRQRARLLAGVMAAVVMVGLVGYGLYRLGKLAVTKLVFENPRFVIAQIVVQDDGVLTQQQVIQFAGVRPGQNLLSLDLPAIQRNLELVSLVRRAEVRRVFPGQLVIQVEERVPVARLQPPVRELGDATFLVDRAGVVMKPLNPGDGTRLAPPLANRMPVLAGVSLADVRVGRRVVSAPIYDALALLDQWEQSALGGVLQIERIDLTKPQQLVLQTRQGTVVHFAPREYPQQLRRLSAILSWAQQRQKTAQQVDLTVARAVPVTWAN